jgi:protein-S-isoprenylcysteine O-methyltransferase Ste14
MATTSAFRPKRDALLASLAFLVLAPGTIAGVGPWVITRWRFRDYPGDVVLRPLGLVLILAGVAVLLEAFARFALEGHGTPAPTYPTDRLIVRGTYRYVRNPMYLAVEGLILGQAALLGAGELIIYGAMIAAAFHLFVIWVEEPGLRRTYRDQYRRYTINVHRWVPRLTPWNMQ